VPIRRLKSEHWIITLDKLLLVAGPLTDTEVVVLLLYYQSVFAEVVRKIKVVKFFGGTVYMHNVCVLLENVYVMSISFKCFGSYLWQYDEVKEKKLEHERKKAQLSALEENWMVFNFSSLLNVNLLFVLEEFI